MWVVLQTLEWTIYFNSVVAAVYSVSTNIIICLFSYPILEKINWNDESHFNVVLQ